MKILVFLGSLAAIFGAFIWYLSKPDWPKYIESVKGEIRHEYSNREGVTVQDVQLVKESDTKLSGFGKLKVNDIEIFHGCTVTVAEDGSNSIWRCAP
jgi:hypothetical protein